MGLYNIISIYKSLFKSRNKNGGKIQEKPCQWAADHLPPLLPPPRYLLRHHSIQSFLFRGRRDSEPHRDVGGYNSLHQVDFILKLCNSDLFIYFSVMEKLPPTSYIRMVDIWLITGQLVPFFEVMLLTVTELKRYGISAINHHGFVRFEIYKKILFTMSTIYFL